MTEGNQQTRIPIEYIGVDDIPILYTNSMLIQIHQPDEFLLTFAQVSPPILLGSPEEQRAQAQSIDAVHSKIVARLALSRYRVRQLIQLLSKHLERFPDSPQQKEGGDADADAD